MPALRSRNQPMPRMFRCDCGSADGRLIGFVWKKINAPGSRSSSTGSTLPEAIHRYRVAARSRLFDKPTGNPQSQTATSP